MTQTLLRYPDPDDALSVGRIDAFCECGEPLAVADSCDGCFEFRCAGCYRIVPWDCGAADEWFAFCDACAVKRMESEP